MSRKENIRSQVFYISGLHCPSCEVLIEKKLQKLKGVIKADVSLSNKTLSISTKSGFKIDAQYLNNLFSNESYKFSEKPLKELNNSCSVDYSVSFKPYVSLMVALSIIILFVLLQKTGLSSLISVNQQSSLPVFFMFGLLAGLSSCAALVGGIILSLSKQWNETYSNKGNFTPHLLFNAGRIVSYGIFGALLGSVGSFFQMSPFFTSVLVITISLFMIVIGLQMLGIKTLTKLQPRLPKNLTRFLSDESNFTSRFSPLLMGALTFFLPCGFTITAQSLALTSANPLQGAAILSLFALGTTPGLLAIGFSSVKFFANPRLSSQFSIVAGALVLFFALFNINSQLNVLGYSNFTDIISSSNSASVNNDGLAPLVNEKQLIKMSAHSYSYSPNRFKVRVNVPVRWEIEDKGTSGCTNAIISQGLFSGQIGLTPGKTSIKEFTPTKPGTYKFSCWMGMVSGIIEVVDSASTSVSTQPAIDSGAQGCGCGGGTQSSGIGTCNMKFY